MKLVALLFFFVVLAAPALGQAPDSLTLKQAEELALKNHPRIMAAQFRASAAEQVANEYRAATMPIVNAFSTGGAAPTNTRIAAGALNNPTILSRYSNGLSFSQLITDFGRTKDLVKSAQLTAQADEQITNSAREDILLQVDQDYFSVLRAQAVESVAEQTVKARQLVLEQISELTRNKLKSSLDLTFAKVNFETAQIMLLTAQNNFKAAKSELTAALGSDTEVDYVLLEAPMPPAPPADVDGLITQAVRNRPDMSALRLTQESARTFAEAEHRLKMPLVSVVGAAGFTPLHVSILKNHYEAAGVNVSIPVFSGHLFSARAAEADLKARAAENDLTDLRNRIVRDVRVGWLNANTAFQQVGLTGQLVIQASESLDLAKTRYDLGLSSIVELNQAQLNLTEAQIQQAQARYEYQIRYAILQRTTGNLQ